MENTLNAHRGDLFTRGARGLSHESFAPYRAWYQELVSNSQTHTFGIGGSDPITGEFIDLYQINTVVRRITLFESGNDSNAWLKGIELEFSDQSVLSAGKSTFYSKSYTFREGETLVGNIEICGANEGVGFFKFCTSSGDCLSAGRSGNRDIYEFYAADRALTGLFGWFGDDIDAMGPIVSRKIASSQLLNVRYSGFPVNQPVPLSKIKTLGHFVIRNESGLTVSHSVSFTKAKESTMSHASESTRHIQNNLDISTEFNGLLPFVLGASTSVSVGFEYGEQYALSYTDEITELESVEVTSSVEVTPYTQIVLMVYQVQEVLDLPYDGTLVTTFVDGTEAHVNISGTLGGVLVSSTQSVVGEELYIGPTKAPTQYPTHHPSQAPSSEPSMAPSEEPSQHPSQVPSQAPSYWPTSQPSSGPSSVPSEPSSSIPSILPSSVPIDMPSKDPSSTPSLMLSETPCSQPSRIPSLDPAQPPTLVSRTTGPSFVPTTTSNQTARYPSYEAGLGTVPLDFNMTACCCDANKDCTKDTRLAQGAQFNICLNVLSPDAEFRAIKTLAITQGDISVHYVTDFIYNVLTSSSMNGRDALISTSVSNAFFAEDSPANIKANGVAVLGFVDMEINDQTLFEALFTVEVGLESSQTASAAQTTSSTSTTLHGGLALAMGSALGVVLLLLGLATMKLYRDKLRARER